MGKGFNKASNLRITPQYLQHRSEMLRRNDWPKSKWIIFCEEMLRLGFVVKLYEARNTKSKYCSMTREKSHLKFKVRFSDHRPIKHRELAEDCDFFVGRTHTGIRNTQDAINAVCEFFGVKRGYGGMSIDFITIDEYVEDFI